MEGKIIKAIAGFYYIHTHGGRVFACRARGLLRKEGVKPLVGDDVVFEVLSEEKKEGSLTRVLPRRNQLLRPAAANVDQALIVFAVREPDPNLNLLDRFLVSMERQGIPVLILFNKTDLDRRAEALMLRQIYEAAGYRVFCGSLKASWETEEEKREQAALKACLLGKTTILAGPSGVGKSSLTNLLSEKARMEVGALSEKIRRGKQTTRHTELFCFSEDSYLLDTPGFTSLMLPGLSPEELKAYFPEFQKPAQSCKFSGCVHIGETAEICGVRRALTEGSLSAVRYENYRKIYEELREAERY